MNRKRIIFLLPSASRKPVGGYKVVYEYANRLIVDGYNVGVVYPAYNFVYNQSPILFILRFFKALCRFVILAFNKKYTSRLWFNLDKNIKEYWVWSLDEKYVPRADIYVATAIQTSVYLNKYKQISNENKYYLIQGFENWKGTTYEQVIETYCYQMKKIVIAHWLRDIVYSIGESCTLIFNGFDFKYFKCTIPIEKKDKFTICMLYHSSKSKGCIDGFKALDIVKSRYPDLNVNIFGVSYRPKELPDWYHYYQRPTREIHNRIYNESSIFIGTSWSEGWGLTLGEAMICGCAVACTDNKGYLEMALNGKTALVSSVKSPESLANNILRLIENDELRYQIARAGNVNIQQFTWERSYKKLLQTLNLV